MKRSTARRMRYGPWRSLAILALFGTAACAPRRELPTPAPDLPPLVRVGLLVDTTQVEIGATTDYEILHGVSRVVLHRIGAGQRVTVSAGSVGGLSVRIGAEETPAPDPVIFRPASGGMVVVGDRPYRGDALVQRAAPGTVTVINRVDMENYLLGVVPYEIGRVGPELLEASKAQAVAARTYAVRYMGRRDSLGFDVFATVNDQVYGGAEGEHEPVSIAVRLTAGEILTYDGEPIEAFYHSTCSGQTAAIEEVWLEEPRPYLRSVIDVNPATGEAFDSTSNRFRWTQTWSADQLREILNTTLADSLPAGTTTIGEILGFETLELTQSGRIQQMRIRTTAGDFYVGRDRIRWIFLTPTGSILNSSKFTVRVERDAQGEITEIIAEGMGWGHGIGMCQVGAMGRARAGQDYRQILRAYYLGTEIERIY